MNIAELKTKLDATDASLAAANSKLDAVGPALGKINTDVTTLLAAIAALQEALANQEVPADVGDKANAVFAAAAVAQSSADAIKVAADAIDVRVDDPAPGPTLGG